MNRISNETFHRQTVMYKSQTVRCFFFSFFLIVVFNSPSLARRKLNLLSTHILRLPQNTTSQYDCEIAVRDIKKTPACQWQKSNFRSQRNSLNISSSKTWASWIPLREKLYKRQIAPKMEHCCYVRVETIRSALSNRATLKNRLQGRLGGEVRWLVFHTTALYPRIKRCKPVDL